MSTYHACHYCDRAFRHALALEGHAALCGIRADWYALQVKGESK